MLSFTTVVFVSMFYAPVALAYLDPGSGSYMLQVAIGLIAGTFFVVKNYWNVIKGYIQNFFKKK